jgi:hypothetical protein
MSIRSHRLHLSRHTASDGISPGDPPLLPTLTIEAAIECGTAIYEAARWDSQTPWIILALYAYCCQRRLPFIRVAIHRSRGTAAVQLAWQEQSRPSVRARLEMEELVERENIAHAAPEVCSQGVWVPAVQLHRVAAVVEQLRALATVGPSWEAQ